jgi:hypothetical protein
MRYSQLNDSASRRTQARKWTEAATHEVADVMEALDDAMVIVDETLP